MMRPILPVLLVAFLTTGRFAMAEVFPVPPVPPAHPPVSEAAPVPNFDAAGPLAPLSDKPSVYVKLYRNSMYDPSVGFVPGSRFQTTEDRKPIQTPGFSISVPLR
jgi:hypothetical protein